MAGGRGYSESMAKAAPPISDQPVKRAPALRYILGQERAIGILRAAAASGRVHHAWIFSGPPGVGKRTTAEAFAALLLDPTTAPNLAGEPEPDPDSETQRFIARGLHPDLHLITKELAAYADDKSVRNAKLLTIPKAVIEKHLLEPIALASSIRTASLASKVFIIDEAELMDRSRTNAPVQNAVLKTLEEPPAGSVIILVSANEDLLLPTIRSRCQRVVFNSLDDPSMDAWLARESLALNAEEFDWVRQFAAGSPGRAQLAAQTGLHQWAGTLDPLLARAEQGEFSPELGRGMKELVESWAKSWVDEHDNASKEAANHAALRHLISLLAERARRRLRAAIGSDAPGPEPVLRLIDTLAQAERVLWSANMEMALELLSVRLTAAAR